MLDWGEEVETSRSLKGEEAGRREMRYSTRGLRAAFDYVAMRLVSESAWYNLS